MVNNITGSTDVSLIALLRYFWRKKVYIFSLPLICAVSTALWTLRLPNIYQSNILLAPAEETRGAGLSGLSSQLGGLASLAGVSLDVGGTDKVGVAISILQSRKFLDFLIKKYDMAVPLVAAKEWDPDTKTLEIDSAVYDIQNKKWIRNVSKPRTQIPSAAELYEVISQIIQIEQVGASGLVTLTVEFIDPLLAQEWASAIVREINNYVRMREILKLQNNIEYLTDQIAQTNNVEVKTVFFELIQEQHKNLMLAEVRQEYIFEVLDPAVVPELKSSPKRMLITLAAGFLAGFLVIIGFTLLFLLQPDQVNEK